MRSGQLARLVTPAGFLAGGSTALLAGGLLSYPLSHPVALGDAMVWIILTATALLLHSLAWAYLLVMTRILPLESKEGGHRRITPFRLAVISLIIFLLLLPTLPLQLRPILPTLGLFSSGSYPEVLLGALAYGFLFIPYLPFLFAPVAVLQSIIFGLYSRRSDGGSFWPRTSIGLSIVVFFAVLGLFGEALSLSGELPKELQPWLFLPLPAGFTALGYWLLVIAFLCPKPQVDRPHVSDF